MSTTTTTDQGNIPGVGGSLEYTREVPKLSDSGVEGGECGDVLLDTGVSRVVELVVLS